MKYPKDVSFHYYRVKRTCDKTKGKPHHYCLEPYEAQWPWAVEPNPRGGMVLCILYKDGRPFVSGTSICSMADNFHYKRGREIAYGRALKEARRKLKESQAKDEGRIKEIPAEGINVASLPEGEYIYNGFRIRLEQRDGGYTIYPEV